MDYASAPGRYRHVVFAPGGKRRGRIVNFAPMAPPLGHGSTSLRDEVSPEEEDLILWLFERAGLDARLYRPETLRRRLPACLRQLRATSPVEARLMLQEHPALVPQAISAMVIGVTGFFRDAGVFDHLTYHTLPALAQRERPRIWSVGCSDGDELYSIAILLAEMNLLERCALLGTDCRATAIEKARCGYYESSSLRDVPRVWVAKYFHFEPPRWRICEGLRSAVQWRTGDVTRLPEPGTWDLILCRNTAMYFRADAASRLWALFERVLSPGGFLVLGKAERPTGATRLSAVAPCIYRRDRG